MEPADEVRKFLETAQDKLDDSSCIQAFEPSELEVPLPYAITNFTERLDSVPSGMVYEEVDETPDILKENYNDNDSLI